MRECETRGGLTACFVICVPLCVINTVRPHDARRLYMTLPPLPHRIISDVATTADTGMADLWNNLENFASRYFGESRSSTLFGKLRY